MTSLMTRFLAVKENRDSQEINRLRTTATSMGEYDLVHALNQLLGQTQDFTVQRTGLEALPANFASNEAKADQCPCGSIMDVAYYEPEGRDLCSSCRRHCEYEQNLGDDNIPF